MKFCMNGALTIGTLDGANIELREEVGADNFFLFGLTAQEVHALKTEGYRPMDYYSGNAHLKEIVDLIRGGYFSQGDTDLFRPLMDNLMYYDPYMLFADFASYLRCQEKVSEVYRDGEIWTRMAILNTARSGRFSSDRTIREYCSEIWRVRPVPIHLVTQSEAGSASFGAAAPPHPTGADHPR
jgi:glycogen phosphorylase